MGEEEGKYGPKTLDQAPIAAPRAARGAHCLSNLKIFFNPFFYSTDIMSHDSGQDLPVVRQN